MLYLRFGVGKERYVISAEHIQSIIPLLKTHAMAGVPGYLAGYIDYKGQAVPVVDLSKLLSGKKSKARLSTRIALINYVHHDRNKTLGFIVEQATEVVKLAKEDFESGAIGSQSMPFLGPLAKDSEGMLQKIDIKGLIELKVSEYLDGQAA